MKTWALVPLGAGLVILGMASLAVGQGVSPAQPDSPAPQAAPARSMPAVDETALRYFARQGDTRRLEAEIARLRALYPDWTPPADPLAIEQGGDPELDRMWQLYATGQYPQVRQAIADRQAREPGWQVPQDLLERLGIAEARQQLINASDLQQYETVVRLGAENPSLLTCSDVDVLWRVARAFAETDRKNRAADAYRYILTNCDDAGERRATMQMALPLLPRSAIDDLLKLERKDAAGVGEFQPIRIDIARQAVAAGGGDAAANATPEELTLFAGQTRDDDAASDALLLGWYYLQRNAFSDARTWFSLAAEREGSAEAARGNALALLGLRDFAAAEASMRPYSSESTESRSVYLAAAANLLAADPPVPLAPEVLAQIVREVATAREPATAEQLGWYAYALNQFTTAEQWFATSLAWRPDAELAAYGLALTRQRLGDRPGLRAIQAAWAGRSERIAAIGSPTGQAPRVAVPRQQAQATRTAEAAPAIAPQAPMTSPQASAPTRQAARSGTQGCRGRVSPESLSAQAALNRGWCLMEADRPMEAAPAFEVALRSNATETRRDAAYGLSLANLRLGLVDRAAVAATQAEQPRNRRIELESAILAQRAAAFFDAGRGAETIMTLDQRARFTPEPLDLMVLRGYAYMKLRRYPDAEKVFKAVAATGMREGIRGLAAVREAMRPTKR